MNNLIYALTCPKCGCPRYIGKTTKGLIRFDEHRRASQGDCSWYKRNWIEALKKDGLTFGVSILATLPSPEWLDEAERYWISYFKNLGCPLTNLTDGGQGFYGWIPSPETRAKIGAANRGKPRSPEHRAKISASLKGRKPSWTGQPITEARKKALEQLHAIQPFTDQFGRIYHSIKEAAERNNLKPSNICHVLKGRRKSTGGLEFHHVDPTL